MGVKKRILHWGPLGVLLVLLTIAIAGTLNVLSYKKVAAGIFTNSQRFVAVGAAEQMEFATRLGKPLDRFYGAEDLLRSVVESSDNIQKIWVLDAERRLLYSTPALTQEETEKYSIGQGQSYSEAGGSYYIEQTFSGDNVICMLLNGGDISDMTKEYIRIIARYMGILAGIAGILVLIAIYRFRFGKRAVITIIIAAQLVLGLLITSSYQKSYLASLNGTAQIIGNVIQGDIEKLNRWGIPREEFHGFEEYLQTISDRIPEIDTIYEGAVPQGSYVEIGDGLGLYGLINESMVRETVTGYCIDTVILIAITIFLILEILFYLDGTIAQAKQRPKEAAASLPLMRLLFFILYLGVNMGAAFVTIVAYRLCLQQNYVSDLMTGLPITAEMISGIVAVLISGRITAKLGYRRTLALCIFICVLGTGLSGFSHNIFLFTVARAITGFGFSLSTITGRIIAAVQPTPVERSSILANLTGGTLIGYCCGAVIGGLLSDRFSYATVFFISALIPLFCLPLLYRCAFPQVSGGTVLSTRGLFSLMRNRSVTAYLILLIVPIYAAGMFVTYCVPLFGALRGMTTTLISALLMANNLIAAYLSPYSTRLIIGKLGSSSGSIVYGILIAMLLALFSIIPTVLLLILVVILLGIADSFGPVVLIDGLNARPDTTSASGTNSMIAATLSGKSGQALAPSLLAAGGGSPILLAVITAAGTILFGLLNFFKKGKVCGSSGPSKR